MSFYYNFYFKNINFLTIINSIQKMFSKIFFSVLSLTCVYKHIFKSIKNKNDANFQELSDNLKFELYRIQTVKQNLKIVKIYLKNIF